MGIGVNSNRQHGQHRGRSLGCHGANELSHLDLALGGPIPAAPAPDERVAFLLEGDAIGRSKPAPEARASLGGMVSWACV